MAYRPFPTDNAIIDILATANIWFPISVYQIHPSQPISNILTQLISDIYLLPISNTFNLHILTNIWYLKKRTDISTFPTYIHYLICHPFYSWMQKCNLIGAFKMYMVKYLEWHLHGLSAGLRTVLQFNSWFLIMLMAQCSCKPVPYVPRLQYWQQKNNSLILNYKNIHVYLFLNTIILGLFMDTISYSWILKRDNLL